MAEAMKGQLTVISEPGRGSTFTLHLPCADQAPKQAGIELRAQPTQPA
jgi:signal transduction histidine kinase